MRAKQACVLTTTDGDVLSRCTQDEGEGAAFLASAGGGLLRSTEDEGEEAEPAPVPEPQPEPEPEPEPAPEGDRLPSAAVTLVLR